MTFGCNPDPTFHFDCGFENGFRSGSPVFDSLQGGYGYLLFPSKVKPLPVVQVSYLCMVVYIKKYVKIFIYDNVSFKAVVEH